VNDRVVITGIGLLSCLGSLRETWQAILANRTGINLDRPFATLPAYPLGKIGNKTANLSQITEIIATKALKDAGISPPLTECGVVVGSSRGCQGIWEENLDRGMAIDWLDSLPHRSAIVAARSIQTIAPVFAPMAACSTGIWSIAKGYELIQMGTCKRVIAGAVEAPITPLSLVGFQQMGALASTGCYPFDRAREGLVLGEGGAILVLETAELARSRHAKIYGEILGFGLTCDAYHLSAPQLQGGSAERAVVDCLRRSNLEAKDIDYIHAHGTSTHLNDLHEAALMGKLFPQTVAVSSTKGATGHTLGASGAIGAAITCLALQEQKLPLCVGTNQPEFSLNLITKPCERKLSNALCFSFGFGGQNGVVAFRFVPKS
jgi:3-oxoacyl-[acyl-carrier-protein] synthase II